MYEAFEVHGGDIVKLDDGSVAVVLKLNGEFITVKVIAPAAKI